MRFSIIVAKTINNIIGIDRKIPWHLTKDLKYFKQITFSNIVIMGRKTWESLPKPLTGRIHIVLSNNPNFHIDVKVGFVANSLDCALQLIQDKIPNFGEIFVIGGGVLYAEAINHPDCDKIYCTEILHYFIVDDVDVDIAYFPQIDKDVYELTETTPIITNNDMSFRFNVYSRSVKSLNSKPQLPHSTQSVLPSSSSKSR